MELVLITDPGKPEKEKETLIQLLDQGLSKLHLRKPTWTKSEIEHWVESIPVEFHSKISLHGEISLAEELGLGGCHFKSEQKVSTGPLRKSKSFHLLKDLLHPGNKSLEYGFISPVFDSISKQGYKAGFELIQLKDWINHNKNGLGFSLYALGGIKETNIAKVKELGFDGVVIMGAIWKIKDLQSRVSAFMEINKQLVYGR